jgi:D-alanine--poly(phosphoribitol) ligase subunit 1
MRGATVIGLMAYVLVGDDSARQDAEGIRVLRAQLAARVPAYMVPRRIRFVSEFPMTPNGKVDRQQVAALAR